MTQTKHTIELRYDVLAVTRAALKFAKAMSNLNAHECLDQVVMKKVASYAPQLVKMVELCNQEVKRVIKEELDG